MKCSRLVLNSNHLMCRFFTQNCLKFLSVQNCSRSIQKQTNTQGEYVDILSPTFRENCIHRIKNLNFDKLGRQHTNSTKQAAVLVPLCLVSNQASILLTVRSPKMGRNKNDISFPGGLCDSKDTNHISTALRETEEEIGIYFQQVDVWAVMPPLPTITSSFLVTPVVGYIGVFEPQNCKINKDEVESILTIPIVSLCDTKNLYYTTFKSKFITSAPLFIVNEYRIWGMTAYILHFLLKSLVPHLYKPKACVATVKK